MDCCYARHFLVLATGLLLWNGSCLSERRMIVPEKPVFALAGDDVVLPCCVQPPTSLPAVEWTRPDLQPKYVHVLQDGRDRYDRKNKAYYERTFLFLNELEKGNVSLKLMRAKISDGATYRCSLPSLGLQKDVELFVGSISQPKVFTLDSTARGVLLRCQAMSLYPEPLVEWREREGPPLPADHTDVVPEPDGRFTVISHVTVQPTSSNWFVCRVKLEELNQTREEDIYVLAVLFNQRDSRDAGLPLAVTVGVPVCCTLVLAAIVIAAVCYVKKLLPPTCNGQCSPPPAAPLPSSRRSSIVSYHVARTDPEEDSGRETDLD